MPKTYMTRRISSMSQSGYKRRCSTAVFSATRYRYIPKHGDPMNLKFQREVAVFFLLTAAELFAAAQSSGMYIPCVHDQKKYENRARELQKIKDADQADRPHNQLQPGVTSRDVLRRKRVGEIFGEGCFKQPADYAAAALVFQHSDQPDHFFQVFLWSKRGVELGDKSQKSMIGLGLDRYLVTIGHKQLFGSQATKSFKDTCWCLEPVEQTFPDEMRIQYTGKTITQYLEWINQLNAGLGCPSENKCSKTLKPTPQGTVPGFW